MFSTVMHRLNERRATDLEGEAADSGFTLIELMVVLLILAILLAIAIPTFLGVTNQANDRAAQSNLNTVLTSGKSVYESGGQSYGSTASLVSSISTSEPSLSGLLVAGSTSSSTSMTAGDIQVYVSTNGNGVVYMSLAKKTNVCWILADNTSTIADTTSPSPWASGGIPTTPGTWYGAYNSTGSGTACTVGLISKPATGLKTSNTGFMPAPAAG